MDQKPKVIIHYASPYYDPVKAHEYYMNHRKLKGRVRSSAALTDKGKEIWTNTRENITAEKKQKLTATDEERKRKVEKLRAQAKNRKDSITRQIKNMMEAIDAKYKKRSEESKENKARGRETLRAEKARVSEDLKRVINAAREAYKQKKSGIREDYEKIYDREYDAILSEYKKPTKTKKGAKSK